MTLERVLDKTFVATFYVAGISLAICVAVTMVLVVIFMAKTVLL
jgi:hypothetical protein